MRGGTLGSRVPRDAGVSASATLRPTASVRGTTCDPTSAQIKVYPPDNTVASDIPAAYTSCGGFRVTSLVLGTGGN